MLEQRLRLMEDREAIRELDATYCRMLDDGRWDELVVLFTENGVFDGLSRVQGRPDLRTFFAGLAGSGLTAFWHYVTNLEIDVQGNMAFTKSFLWQPCVVDGRSWIAAGRYLDTVTRTDEGWLYTEKKVRFHYFAPADDGWAEGQFGLESARAAAYNGLS